MISKLPQTLDPAAAKHTLDVMRIAAKAEALDHIVLVLGEIESLEEALQKLHASKSRTVDLKRLEIMGRLRQAKDMLKRMRQRYPQRS